MTNRPPKTIYVGTIDGMVLDYLVATCLGLTPEIYEENEIIIQGRGDVKWSPSTNCDQGNQIIEQYNIKTYEENAFEGWCAEIDDNHEDGILYTSGPSRLIAAMRCFVAMKMDLEIFHAPDELYDYC